MAKLLSEPEKIGIVYGLARTGVISQRDAEIYVLREFGTNTEPPYRYHKLKTKLKVGSMDIARVLRAVRPLYEQEAIRVLSTMMDVSDPQGLAEEDVPLSYTVTLQFGHRAHPREDTTAKKAIRATRG